MVDCCIIRRGCAHSAIAAWRFKRVVVTIWRWKFLPPKCCGLLPTTVSLCVRAWDVSPSKPTYKVSDLEAATSLMISSYTDGKEVVTVVINYLEDKSGDYPKLWLCPKRKSLSDYNRQESAIHGWTTAEKTAVASTFGSYHCSRRQLIKPVGGINLIYI